MAQVQEKGGPVTTRAFVNERHEATIVCPECGRWKTIDTTPFAALARPLRVKCGCALTFYVILERRRFYRKKTDLPGTYVKIGVPEATPEPMRVENLSLGGVGFRTRYRHDLKVNDVLEVRFVLDTARRPEIVRTVIVRNVDDRYIGAEFREPDPYDEELGGYLAPD
ncbi:MAG: hypothetical protein KatS3mg131_1510 [Candidatus Tectimicrobiota bacterium]|nr:MAG: hypothetical protein KatS3mg131_1510 [Candidatus Tectomicrobia bacterium]